MAGRARSVGIAIAASVGIVAGLLALILGPAHVQTRGLKPELPETSDLRGLLQEPDRPVDLRFIATATQTTDEGTLGHNVALLRWSDGRTFMIDAGMDEEESREFAALISMIGNGGEHAFHGTVPDFLEHPDGARDRAPVGDALERITGVGFTHLHIDHVQGIGAFCAARGEGARRFQTPDQRAEHNMHTTESAALLEGSCLAPGRLDREAGALLRPAGFPGLALVPIAGHTPGSTLFAAAVGDRLWLFSGDITNSKADLLEDRGKGFVYSFLLVPENTAQTARLRRWLRELEAEPDVSIFVSHDTNDARAQGVSEIVR